MKRTEKLPNCQMGVSYAKIKNNKFAVFETNEMLYPICITNFSVLQYPKKLVEAIKCLESVLCLLFALLTVLICITSTNCQPYYVKSNSHISKWNSDHTIRAVHTKDCKLSCIVIRVKTDLRRFGFGI